jgi:hypothetical protein
MTVEIGYVYVLSKESKETIERFKERQGDGALRSKLDWFTGDLFYASASPDEKTALDAFMREWEGISDPSRWKGVRGSFKSCGVLLREIPALRRSIDDSEDFVFYLKNEDGVGALLRNGLRRAEVQQERGPGWAVEAQLPAILAGTEGVDFNATISVEPPAGTSRFSFDQELWLWDEEQERVAKGRILACLCERGESWSVSFRKTEKRACSVNFRKTEKRARNKRRPGAEPCYLNNPATIIDLLYQTVFEVEGSEQHGLVVIAGRTGSCKSQIAKGLIESRLKEKRGKHLVTYEDPIERKFKTKGSNTSREKGKDVSDLHEATRNALRQKPDVLFVGETRDPEEWDMLLHYAGTGHLVVTTAHAGSLIEAMGNILEAMQANDPTSRSVIGERLLAVVHLKSEKAGSEVGILIPALWRRTSEGIKALMSEGLSSLVPNTPPRLAAGQVEREPLPSSIGRYWFARELLEKEDAVGKLADIREVKNSALEWDLQGV